MNRGAIRAGRAAAALLVGSLLAEGALQVLLGPYPGRGSLDERMTRAFHEALLRPDDRCGEVLRADLQLLWPLRGPREPLADHAARRPVEIRTNALGMRMRAVERVKPPSTFRIACVGDSVTFGWAVAERDAWPRVLERSLRASSAARTRIEVLNLGVPGHTTLQALRRLERDVLALDPDVIVLATGFNDGFATRHEPDRQRLTRPLPPAFPSLGWWLDRSALAHVLGTAPIPAPATTEHAERLPVPERDRARRALITRARDAGVEVLLANLCFPHARIGDELAALAQELDLPYLDGRAVLLPSAPAQPDDQGTLHRVPLHPSDATLHPAATWIALARPERPFATADDLRTVPPTEVVDGTAFFELDLRAFRDVAFVPRAYLDAAPHTLERLNYLYFHRVDDAPDVDRHAGRFRGASYLATDAPFFPKMTGECVHPGPRGHAELARALEDVLRRRTRLRDHLR